MKSTMLRYGLTALLAAVLAGCGGGDSTPAPPPVTPTPPTVADTIKAAAATASNDAASNSSASFAVVQAAGVATFTAGIPNTLNFSVFSDGAVLQNLKLAANPANNVRVGIAKLVPGANGNPDQWVSYVTRTKTTTASNKGPNGEAAVMASAVQATTDPYNTDATKLAAQLVYNADGYYTYTFNTAFTIADADKALTHRIALQLSYTNAAGVVVKANPYFDFTIGADGKAVAVTDPTKTRKMTDVSSCNSCHEKLALHGGGRVDTQYCVICHNPGTTDPVSGNVVTLSNMVHKIHAGKKLAAAGQPYYVSSAGYSEVGFPQDLRNCTKCHTGANAATPQGDNWKTKVSKEACLGCHADKIGSTWEVSHKVYAQSAELNGGTAKPAALAADLTNAQCNDCHKSGTPVSPERVHWNQNEENAAKYKMNIESATYDAATRKVTVKYFLSDPTNGNAAYNLVAADCASLTVPTCSTSTKFGNLRLYVGYQNMAGQSATVTEFTAGSVANGYAYKGVNDGNNHYTLDIVLPAPVAGVSVEPFGSARVVSIGQIKERKLQVKWATDPRPEVEPVVLQNVIAQNTYFDFALTGTLTPRRTVVATAKCNDCHGALGTTSGANTLSEAFHSGARNTVEACAVCHDVNRASNGNMMTNGLALYESYQFKRMIHGIHGNSKRTSPFTHGNKVQGVFGIKTGALTAAGTFYADQKVTIGTTSTTVVTAGTPVAIGATFQSIADITTDAARAAGYTGNAVSAAENYAAEVAWPGVGINCNACHVNNSYKQDLGPLGTVAQKPYLAGSTTTLETDPTKWLVMSPKASSCTACHDSSAAIGHVTSFGGSAFGDKTQAATLLAPRESCDDCHAPGGFKGVDVVHGLN